MDQQILNYSEALRNSTDPLYAAGRAVLIAHDIDVTTTLLLDHYPDDPGLETYYALTADHQFLHFDVGFYEEGTYSESYWECTPIHKDQPPFVQEMVQAGLEILEGR